MKKLLAAVVCVMSLSAGQQTTAGETSSIQVMESLPLTGSAEFKFFLWNVYKAELYSANDFQHFESLPFVLKLTYARRFSQQQLLQETQKQFIQTGVENALVQPWLDRLSQIFPDVQVGHSLLLFVDADGYSHFYLNEEFLGSIEDPLFSKQFSAIWLARNDRYAEFTQQLIGE